jgi:hypothetical protein
LRSIVVTFDSLERTQLTNDRARAYASRAVHDVRIGVGSATISVRFSRAAAAAAFAERFADMRGTSEPAITAYAVDFSDEAFFWCSSQRVHRWPQRAGDGLLAFFADTLAMHEYLTTKDDFAFHAAVVANDAALAAIVGSSTAGKTTTAIAAARNGFAMYSDERCVVQNGLVVPFLRAVSVREGGRALLLADPRDASPIDARLREMPVEAERTIRPSRLLRERAGGPPRPLGAVFVLDGHAHTPELTACTLYDVLPALLRSAASKDKGLDRTTRLARELRNVPLFRLRLGTPDATARSLEKALASLAT